MRIGVALQEHSLSKSIVPFIVFSIQSKRTLMQVAALFGKS